MDTNTPPKWPEQGRERTEKVLGVQRKGTQTVMLGMQSIITGTSCVQERQGVIAVVMYGQQGERRPTPKARTFGSRQSLIQSSSSDTRCAGYYSCERENTGSYGVVKTKRWGAFKEGVRGVMF